MTDQVTPTWIEDVEPKHEGLAGKAWQITLPERSGDWRDDINIDAQYVIYAPAAHMLWSWHVLFIVSLRDVPGQDKPPVKHFPEATHEIMVWALDPGVPAPDPRKWPAPGSGELQLLQPPDVIVQFHVESDEHATEIAHLTAKACTTGVLVPDSDWRSSWEATLATTAEHYRDGRHG